MKHFLFIIISFSLISMAWGQSKVRNQLSGKVTDAKTGTPLAGASVILSDSRIGTVTDTGCHYVLKNVPSGHTVLEISFEGYKTLIEHTDVTSSDVQNFALYSTIIVNEGVTVTGVANATSIRKAPIPITRVSRTDILSTASSNIIDALSRQPGISQLSTGPAISKPIIRGLGYNRLVVINDGVRQEGQQWGDEHGIEIDENSVNRVEILKGPASLIYGSDAIAGVINIITTTPAPNNTVRGNILSDYQTNNHERSLFANIGGNQNGFNWNVWGDYKAAADYHNKYDGRVFNSKFNERNFGGYLGYNGAWGFSHLILSNFNQRLGIVEGVRDEYGNLVKSLPGGVEGIPTENDFNSTDPQIPYQHVQHFKAISDNSFKIGSGRLTLNLGWQRNQRMEFGNPDDPAEKSLYFDLQTFNYSTAYHLKDMNGWTTSIGVNGMAQNNQNKGQEVLIPEYDLFDIGGFIYTQKTIDRTTLSGGIRYDYRSLNSKEFIEGNEEKFSPFKKQFSNFSASVGASYAINPNFLLKANLAQGFRAPSIPELASNGAHEGTNRYEYGDQNLSSEISLQGDAGLEINSDHVLFTASVFYNHINNFIFYSKLAGANGGDSLVAADGVLIPAYKFGQHNAHLAGAEFLLDIHPHPLDWLHWQNTFSFVRGLFDESVGGDRDIPFIPAAHWISQLRGEFLKKGKSLRDLSVYFELDNTSKQDHPFTAYQTETSTPGYALLNAGISTNIISHNKTLFSIYLNAMNIGDVAYQSSLSRLKYTDVNQVTGRQGVFNMGRNFSIKLNIPLNFNTQK